jgi:hypothetical protein
LIRRITSSDGRTLIISAVRRLEEPPQRPLHIGGENPLHAQTLVDASLKH